MRRGDGLEGLCRVTRHGPEMLVYCRGCERSLWLAYGQTVCTRCEIRRERAREAATRRGGFLLVSIACASLVALDVVDPPLLVSLPLYAIVVALAVEGATRLGL